MSQLAGARRPALYMKQAMGEAIEKRDLQQLVRPLPRHSRQRASPPSPPPHTLTHTPMLQAIWWGLSKRPNFWAKTPTEAALAHALHRHAQRLLSAEVPAGGEDAAFLHVHRPAPP